MKKHICMVLALAMVLGLAACGGSSNTTAPDAANSDSISVCISSEPDTLDPGLNTAMSGCTMCAHLFSGLAKWDRDANGNAVIAADCATELPEGVVNEDGTVTYTYTLRDGLRWSDGQDLTAGDFEFAWKRAASTALGADFGYLLGVIKGYPDDLAVEATDDRTLVVTLNNFVAYWNELMACPVYFPVREDVVADEGWATDPSTYISNGPYTMTSWNHNSVITLTKNENFYNADNVTMKEIKFYLSDDVNNNLSNFKNGDWQLINELPSNEMAALAEQYPGEYFVRGDIGNYNVCWNVNAKLLPDGCNLTGVEAENAKAEIRSAIALLFDRNYIVEQIAQGGQIPASSVVAMGITDADGSEFYMNAGRNHGQNDGFVGYFDVSEEAYESNFETAIETLKKYYTFDEATQQFTNFPTLTYLYNTNESHKAVAEYLSATLAAVGITMNMENQEWNTFLNTRKNGDYCVSRHGWIADYNDPSSFLEVWAASSGNNSAQLGKGDHANVKAYSVDLTDLGYDVKVENGTWAQTYDKVLDLARTCTDSTVRYELLHRAEDLLMSTGCIAPLYFNTDIYMLNSSVHGFYSNPLGYKYFMYCTIG